MTNIDATRETLMWATILDISSKRYRANRGRVPGEGVLVETPVYKNVLCSTTWILEW